MAFPVGGYANTTAAGTDGMEHYWAADETSGTTVTDSVNGGAISQNFTVSNDATDRSIENGKFNAGRYILGPGTGSARAIMKTTVTNADAALSTVSVSMWFALSRALTLGEAGTLLRVGTVSLDVHDLNGTTTRIGLYNGALSIEEAVTVAVGNIYHVGFTLSAGVDMKVFFEGAQLGSTLTNAGVVGLDIYQNLWWWGSFDDTTVGYIPGTVDDLGIWNRVLADSEFTEIYNLGAGTPLVIPAKGIGFEKFDETVNITPELNLGFGLSLADTCNLSETFASAYGATLQDILNGSDSATSYAKQWQQVLDTIGFSESIRQAYYATRSETMNLLETWGDENLIIRHMYDTIRLTTAQNATAFYRLLASDTINFLEELFHGFGADLSDTVNFTETLLDTAMLSEAMNEQMDLSDSAVPTLFVMPTLQDDLIGTDAIDSLAYLRETLAEELELVVGFANDGEQYLGFTVNTTNAAVTEYNNYGFTSFAKHQGRYIATSPTGLYELSGTQDAGAIIQWSLKSGMFAPNGQQLTRVVEAFLGVRTSGTIVFKLVTADSQEYWYETQAMKEAVGNTRVKFGKGLRTRYWQFEMASKNGEDMELDDVEFTSLKLTRKV